MSSLSPSATPPSPPRRRRWRWLKRCAWVAVGLVLLLVIFHRPLLKWGAEVALEKWAKSEGLSSSGQVLGSFTRDLGLKGLSLKGGDATMIREISWKDFSVDYDLWALKSDGLGSVVKKIELHDAVIDIDLTKPFGQGTPEPEKEEKKPSQGLKISLPEVHLSNITVRLHDHQGATEIEGLNVQLERGKLSPLSLSKLTLPNNTFRLNGLKGQAGLEGQSLSFKDLTFDQPLIIQELKADLGQFEKQLLPISLKLSRDAAKVSVDATLTLGEAPAIEAQVKASQLSEKTAEGFVTLPEGFSTVLEDLTMEAKGPLQSPAGLQATISALIGQTTVAGLAVDQIALSGRLAKEGWKIEPLTLKRGQGQATLSAALNPPTTWDQLAQAPVSAKAEFNFPQIESLFTQKAPVSGGARGLATVSLQGGKVDHLQASLMAEPLVVSEKSIPKITASLTGQGQQLTLQEAIVTLSEQNKLTAQARLNLEGNRPFSANWKAEVPDFPAFGEWLKLANQPLPQRGNLQATGTAVGDLKSLESKDLAQIKADAAITAQGIEWNGSTVEKADIRASLLNNVATLDSLLVKADEKNQLTGQGSLNLGEQQSFTGKLDLALTELKRLSGWSQLGGGPEIESGALQAQWQGQGQIKDISVTGQGSVQGEAIKTTTMPKPLAFAAKIQHEAKSVTVSDLSLQAGALAVKTGLTFSPESLDIPSIEAHSGKIAILKGAVALPLKLSEKFPIDPNRPVAITIDSDNADVAEVLALAGQPAYATGKVSHHLSIKGQWPNLIIEGIGEAENIEAPQTKGKLQPGKAHLRADFRDNRLKMSFEAEHRPLAPIKSEAQLDLNLAKLIEEPKNILDAPLKANLTLEKSDLAPLTKLVDSLKQIEGQLAMNVDADGPLRKPRVKGKVTLDAPKIALANDQAPELRDVRLRLTASETNARLESLSASIGGGKVESHGRVDWSNAKDPSLDFSVTANEALVMRNDMVSLRTNANIRCQGTVKSAAITGEVGLVRGRVFKEIEFLPLSLPGQLPPPPPPVSFTQPSAPTNQASAPGPLDQWTIDLAVKTKDHIRLLGNVLNGGVMVDLKVGGSPAKPWLQGLVSVQEGRVKLPFSRLNLTKADVSFDKEQPFEPKLKLEGDSFVSSYMVHLHGSGSALNPTLRFTSSPPLSEGDIATLLATGATSGDLTSSEGEAANRAAFLLLSQTYRKLFKKSTTTSALAEEPPKLSVGFTTIDGSPPQRAMSATYELTPHWQLIGAAGQKGTFRGLLYYLIRFR